MFIAIAVIALFDPIWDGKEQNCQVPQISRRDYMFIAIAVIALFDPIWDGQNCRVPQN
jgi:hypothetical protein